jgi:RNA polymerase sigma-70 factor (ECF subfamily)
LVFVTNRSALEALLAARTPALLRTAYLLTGDPDAARDLLQSALERVTKKLGSIKEPQAIESYLRATMATTAANQRQRFWRREIATERLPEVPGDVVDLDTRMVLQRALQQLPPDQRTVLVLRFYEDLTEPQTAAILGIAVGTVKSRASRGLHSLRDAGIALSEDRT